LAPIEINQNYSQITTHRLVNLFCAFFTHTHSNSDLPTLSSITSPIKTKDHLLSSYLVPSTNSTV